MKSRRDFLKKVACIGGVAVAGSFLQSCGLKGKMDRLEELEKAMQPPPLIEQKARVALVKTENRAEGIESALNLLGINPAEGRQVFLKPNFNSADPFPGSTHNETLETLVSRLWDMGATSIVVGDRSGMGDTREVMQNKGIFEMAKRLDFEVLALNDLTTDRWEMFQPEGSHWQKGFPFSKDCLRSPCVVQTCNLKTHRFGGHFTLSLKNSVGLAAKFYPGDSYDYMRELHSSPDQRLMIAEINSAYSPNLILMDGVEAFAEGGPDKGKKVKPNVILASTDRIAVDAVGVAILRQFGTTPEVSRGPVFQQQQIARAVELELGVDSPENIAIISADPEAEDMANELKAILLEE